MPQELIDEVLRGKATEAPVLGQNDDVEAAHGLSYHLLLLQSAQLGAHRRGIALDRLDRVGGGEMVGPVRRQIPNVLTGPHNFIDNLRYLDIAVLLRIWKQWGLTECLEQLMPKGEADVSPAAVVAALTIQRCVAPGSKLFATQWIPTSALPELLGFGPSTLNNTRLHRVLDKLEESTSALMAMLPPRYTERHKAFSALFLDVTDTWFVGHGPKMAQRSTPKEGMIRRKVGIVLLCNELGYPLRWEVIEGKCADSTAMEVTAGGKVRAHVTICMLSLLRILRAQELADQGYLADHITPR